MKNLLLFFLLLCATAPAFAQSSDDDDLAMIQAAYGRDKRDVVNDFMKLNDTQQKAFSPLYEAYEKQRRALAKERIEILKVYSARYSTMEDHLANALAERTLANDTKYNNLYKEYLKKIGKVLGGQNAAKFLQLEVYLQNAIRTQIQSRIPFIGELDQHRRPLN